MIFIKTIKLNGTIYEVITDYKDALNEEVLTSKLTDYFDNYTYIVGDWAYGKLRLKGFYDDDYKDVKKYNSIKNLDTYLKNNCAYGCRYFCIKKRN